MKNNDGNKLCRIDKKNFVKKIVSGQFIYRTSQQIVNPNPDLFIEELMSNLFTKCVMSKHASINPFRFNNL